MSTIEKFENMNRFFFRIIILLGAYFTSNSIGNTVHSASFVSDLLKIDSVYDQNIRTVLFYRSGDQLSGPEIKLNSGERLTLRFDQMSTDAKDYYYSIEHCNHLWQPSDLMEIDYLTELPPFQLLNNNVSFTEFQPYTHHFLELPNDQLSIIKSGFYLLTVFEDSDPEQIVLTRRFVVYENQISISPRVRRPSNVNDREYRQEVDFSLNCGDNNFADAFSNFHITIRQNRRWDNAKTGFTPIYVKGRELVYDYSKGNVFDGNNEFRNFDITDLQVKSPFILDYVWKDSNFVALLKPEDRRTFRQYYSDPDINGNRVIRTANRTEQHTESEYIKTVFSLKVPQEYKNGDIYIFGALSDWKCQPRFKMIYDPKLSIYQCVSTIKQGYYNYYYAFSNSIKSTPDISFCEGTHFETENNYDILVSYSDPKQGYDRVIGIKHFKSIYNN